MKNLLFTFLLLVLSFNNSKAQQVRVDAVLDTSRLRIGEQVTLDLYLNYDSNLGNLKVKWPPIGDTLTSKVEVISISPIDTTYPSKKEPSRIFQHQQLKVSVYDSGFYAIPPFKFELNEGKDSLFTNPLFLEVHTLPVDTLEGKYKDIKEPFDEPFNWRWYLPVVLWGLAAILAVQIIVLIVLRLTRKNKKQEDVKPKEVVPAHILALSALEKIQKEAVWREGKVKEYYSELSDTIRLYIEQRFELPALESTTDEIMKAFRSRVVDSESKERLEQLLRLSDLVKFAKMNPLESEFEISLKNAFDFVNGTKREDPLVVSDTNKEEEKL